MQEKKTVNKTVKHSEEVTRFTLNTYLSGGRLQKESTQMKTWILNLFDSERGRVIFDGSFSPLSEKLNQ